MSRGESVELLDRLLLNPDRAKAEAIVRETAAHLVTEIRGHPLSYHPIKGHVGQPGYMGGMEVTVELPDSDTPPDRVRVGHVWVPDVSEDDAFKAQLVVEVQLRALLGLEPIAAETRQKGARQHGD